MDSMQFYRETQWNLDREQCDAGLRNVLYWVATRSTPDRVFSTPILDLWATQNGYSKFEGRELVELLRQAKAHVPAPSLLNTLMNDAIHKHGGYTT